MRLALLLCTDRDDRVDPEAWERRDKDDDDVSLPSPSSLLLLLLHVLIMSPGFSLRSC